MFAYALVAFLTIEIKYALGEYSYTNMIYHTHHMMLETARFLEWSSYTSYVLCGEWLAGESKHCTLLRRPFTYNVIKD
jgi:hypothetical protein